jgi:hypothetical protein
MLLIAELLTPYSDSLPGTPPFIRRIRQQLLAAVGSGVYPAQYKCFLTYAANDLYWPEVYRMILRGDETEHLSLAERRQLLAANPVLAAQHYFDRQRALEEHILRGAALPLGRITEYRRRNDQNQRQSFTRTACWARLTMRTRCQR